MLGINSLLYLLPVLHMWWTQHSKPHQRLVEPQYVVFGSLLLLPIAVMWLSDPALRCRQLHLRAAAAANMLTLTIFCPQVSVPVCTSYR